MTNRQDIEQRIRTIEQLVRRLEIEADPELRGVARELVQALLEFHAAGLTRALEIVDDAGVLGAALIDRFGADELVKPLLLLHGLHPLDLPTRVVEALEQTRPWLRAHGGDVEYVGVDEAGVVTLRLEASGCGSAHVSLKTALEDALREAAPDLSRLVIEHTSESSGTVAFVPMGEVRRSNVAAERSVG